MSFFYRLLLGVLGLGIAMSVPAATALAQDKYPSRPIRMIVPLPPGGAIDVFARALAKEFEQRSGGTMVIENRAGGNTMIAANACKNAAADGYTICLLTRTTVSINPEVYKKITYDPPKDFDPIINGFFGQQIVILNKAVPVNTFAELVEYSKKNPDKLNFASMGLGGDSHLVMEWLKNTTGARIVHVPYKGFPEAIAAFKANDVQMIALLIGNPDLARQIREGEVKGILLPGTRRSPVVPNVPTFAEAGLASDENTFTPWFGLFAPKGTPRWVIDRLNADFAAIIGTKGFTDRFLTPNGFRPAVSSPETFAEFLAKDRASAAKLVAISGVKVDQ
jgi:tripartite-type tricarboxylate transporter receptor subunit TctC